MRIEEPFCDDVIRTLLKVDGPALPAWLADRASRGTAEAAIQAVRSVSASPALEDGTRRRPSPSQRPAAPRPPCRLRA